MYGMKPALLMLLAGVPAMVFAACGGGEEKQPVEDFVQDLCDAALDFWDETGEEREDFPDIDFNDPESAKDAYIELGEAELKIAEDYKEAIDELKTPDIEAGDEVLKAVKADANRLMRNFEDFVEGIKDIDDDTDSFSDDYDEVVDSAREYTLREDLEDLADEHDEVDDLLDLIDEEDPDCALSLFPD